VTGIVIVKDTETCVRQEHGFLPLPRPHKVLAPIYTKLERACTDDRRFSSLWLN